MSKIDHLQRMLEQRIRNGDYLLKGLPPERELADQVGVARMTARKAVQSLVDRGMLERAGNGRLVVSSQAHGTGLRLGLLVPSITSPSVEEWRLQIAHAARAFSGTVHLVMYTHWDDTHLIEALRVFDGVFLYPSADPIPDHVIRVISAALDKLVVVERDLTAHGIRSINPFPPQACHKLLDHLATLGHRRIDCFNVQPIDPVIQDRITQWNVWRAAKRLKGRLLGDPKRPIVLPIERARLEMLDLLDAGDLDATALLCTTAPAAIGACRALADRGRIAGRDLAVCCINDESLGRFVVPSITSLIMPDPKPLIHLCLECFATGRNAVALPLLLEPTEVPIFFGESTGSADASLCASTQTSRHLEMEKLSRQ